MHFHQRWCPISEITQAVTRSRFSVEKSTPLASSVVHHYTRDRSSQSTRARTAAVSRQASWTVHPGYGGLHQLFVRWDENIINISRAHVSRWMVETIKEAYNRVDLDLDRVWAHQVWARSSSWAYLNQIPLDNVLAAAFWRLQGVFQRHYLRDLAQSSGYMFTLGPVVAAQAVVQRNLQ